MIPSTFPRIPHVPGSSAALEDVHLDDDELAPFLEEPVWVFEKLDGLNVTLRATRRGVDFALKPEWRRALGGGVERALGIFVRQREDALRSLLDGGRQLYGEWLWHTVSTRYTALPDVFVGFALRTERGRLLRPDEATAAMAEVGIAGAEPLFAGTLRSLARLRELVQTSRYGPATAEGVIVERDHQRLRWAKYVDPGYAHPSTGALSGALNDVVSR